MQVQVQHLYGLWHARFDGDGGEALGATLLLERNPQSGASVLGHINRNGDKAQVAGDVQDGEFTLEESADGVHIDSTWSGTVSDNSCAKEIKGLWTHALTHQQRPFVLRKLPGWQ